MFPTSIIRNFALEIEYSISIIGKTESYALYKNQNYNYDLDDNVVSIAIRRLLIALKKNRKKFRSRISKLMKYVDCRYTTHIFNNTDRPLNRLTVWLMSTGVPF